MRALLCIPVLSLLPLVGCSSDDGGASGVGADAGPSDAQGADTSTPQDGSAGSGGSGGSTGADATPPPVTCDAPDLADVSSAAVVGTGSPASCTEAALQAAADEGGAIVFDCGDDPVTIEVTATITFKKETVLDGGGLVTLSGGGTTRILYLDSGYDQTSPRLVVQRLTFRDGRSPSGGDDTAQGGGAIYRDGGSLTVIDCNFFDNHAPSPGQDIAGGAIYAFGGGDTVISGCNFSGNSASNGGAIGSLNGDLTLINSTFVDNAATGTEGNPGNGGCGGTIYMDGRDEATIVCGVSITGSEAGAIGGAFFRVSNDSTGSFSMDRSTIDGNRVTPTDSGNAGGMYLQGLALTITNSTISRNEAHHNGGLWIHGREANLTNVTIAENVAFGTNGGGLWLSNSPTGTLLNCTIANNHATGEDKICGAIFGAGLTLKNTIVAGNTAMWTPGCDETHGDGGGNIQWPDKALCTDDILVADPALGELGDHGGETETMVPSGTSPALGIGSGCPATDQRGNPRSEPCTVGAVEVL
jgi:parallel beta-helix repeat protein